MSAQDLYLAGLLEGEGCFGMRKAGGPRGNGNIYRTLEVSLGMTDRDVIARVANLWGASVLASPRGHHKTLYRTRLTGVRAGAVMVSIFSQMGERRRECIERCLAQWEHGHKPRWGWIAWQKRKSGALDIGDGIRHMRHNTAADLSVGGNGRARPRAAP